MERLKKIRSGIKYIFSGPRLSIVYLALFCLFVLCNLLFGSIYHSGLLREGDISLKTIYAPHDFKYPLGIDEVKTAETRERVKKQTPSVFYVDNAIEEGALNRINRFFDYLDTIRSETERVTKKEAIKVLKKETGIDVDDNIVLFFSEREDIEAIRTGVVDIVTSIYPLGIIDPDEKSGILQDVKFVRIKNTRIRTDRIYPIDDIITVEKAGDISQQYASRIFQNDARLRNNAIKLIEVFLTVNVVFDPEETEAYRKQALENTPEIYNMVAVKKNELIVEKGQRVTADDIQQLMALGIVGDASRRGPYMFGILLLLIILISFSIAYLNTVDKKILTSHRDISIILVNCLIFIFLGQFFIESPQSYYIMPLSGICMLISLLVSVNSAFMVSIVLSIFLGVVAGGKVDLMLVLMAGGFAGSYVAKNARRRSKILMAGLTAGFSAALTAMMAGLLNNLDYKLFFQDSIWAFGSGVVSIFLVMGALPLFEYTFKITTDITLLELSDLNHPLLKELTLKAPGTYQHSIMVGNLAEAACDAIGANSLLARVGSYYHDIGKIEKGEYFSENEMGSRSKHDKLTPSMSALIIVNHVKDGIELAKKYKLNSKIIDFIGQHHGTGLIYYFYQRALEKAKEEHELDEEEFRYTGPKPQSKEAAIVLLADSVEASSRALSDPTPSRIRGLVQKIINNKFIDDQLDECDLTLKDLNKIATGFVRVLTAVFHTRLEYPEKSSSGIKKQNGKTKSA